LKKTLVGLVILIKLPPSTDRLAALLHVRGAFDYEKMQPETYPGACQISVFGEVNGGETIEKAVTRETEEELGFNLQNILLQYRCAVTKLTEQETADSIMVFFSTIISFNLFKEIRLPRSSGGLRLIEPHQLETITLLKKSDKSSGIKDRTAIAMFPEEKEAVSAAFKKFREPAVAHNLSI